jgi:hypothetical protein
MSAFEKICYVYERIRLVNDEAWESPGLARDAIAKMFKDIDLSPQPLLVDLYEWHNGIYNLDAFFHLLSLSESMDTYNSYKAEKNEYLHSKWQTCLFPLFSMNGDVDIFVDMNVCSLIAIDREGGSFEEIAAHYENYLNALVEVFESDLFIFEDVSGSININKAFWQNMLQKYKIKNAWWKD